MEINGNIGQSMAIKGDGRPAPYLPPTFWAETASAIDTMQSKQSVPWHLSSVQQISSP